MKNTIGLRSILAVILIIASLCSYIYLNTLQFNDPSSGTPVESLRVEEEPIDHEVLFPDVEIIKKVIEKSRQVIHLSS